MVTTAQATKWGLYDDINISVYFSYSRGVKIYAR